MLFRQLFDNISSTYTYLIASRKGGEALIIDPVLEKTDHYIKLLDQLELRLVKVIDTHIHADHISGIAELRDRTKCVTLMGEQAPADVVSMHVKDNEKVKIEGIELLRALENNLNLGTFVIHGSSFAVDVKRDLLRVINLMPKDPIRKLY